MKRKNKDEKITTVLQGYIASNKKIRNGLINEEVARIWKENMPDSVKSYTKSIVFSYGKVYLKVDSAALKQELHSSRDKLKNLLNKELESDLVQAVYIS